MTRPALAALLLLALPAGAQTGDLELGERLARQWCANCHAVAPGMAPPTGDAAPPFAAIAPRATAEGLRAFLALPHPDMPDHRLSRAEADAVIAWLLAQRR